MTLFSPNENSYNDFDMERKPFLIFIDTYYRFIKHKDSLLPHIKFMSYGKDK